MASKSRINSWGWTTQSALQKAMALKPEGRLAEVRVHLGKGALVPKAWAGDFFSGNDSTLLRIAERRESSRLLLSPLQLADPERDPKLKMSLKTRVRDAMGTLVATLERLEIGQAEIDLDLPAAALPGAILGLEMALYRYKRCLREEPARFHLQLKHKGRALPMKAQAGAIALGRGVNLARHLVNLPPNFLNPVTYADFVAEQFAQLKAVKVDVWDEVRLQKERMGLHLAVGQGSSGAVKKAPLAFVGKGITFDSGGLDIKPASGMRLMKKDMGGSAAVAGLALWAAEAGVRVNMDFYLALAENAIGGRSFRPGDVITARNGDSVEIHNTDAEGRLVLSDALNVAITAKEKPRVVIDVATLTGAIKTALGAPLAGLFANDSKLAAALCRAGQESGDHMWTMPLVQKYKSTFSTPFADLVNATDGFGGAITAALFLERFVGNVPWAHLDIYAWKDAAEGACLESGGNGQAVCALAEWLQG